MSTQKIEIEGLWEEIAVRAAEFAGRRVRLTVLPAAPEAAGDKPAIRTRKQRMLATFRKRQRTPLSQEEAAILDEFEQFRKEHPVSFRRIGK